MLQLFLSIILVTSSYVIDFGAKENGQNWYITNDGVMGGLSKGKVEFSDNSMIFSGVVSLENNGGFTKIDAPYGNYDLSTYNTVVIRAKGTGHVAAFQLDLYRQFYLPTYKVMLQPTSDWQEYTFKLNDFKEYRMGRKIGEKMSKTALASIIRMGFIMSEKTEGPFEWEIDYIKFE